MDDRLVTMQVGIRAAVSWSSAKCYLAVGYRWSRAIPVARRGILQGGRLLRSRVRCQQFKEFRYSR